MTWWNGKIIVTGGAGFIGSCMVRTLNDMGLEDLIIVDHIASTDKWMNLRNKKYLEYVPREQFMGRLIKGDFDPVGGILHFGACSATTEKDFDYLWNNNVQYTKALWRYAKEKQIPFIYASSAATYGDGTQGFDDNCDIDHLRPLNGYGYSKQVFDQWVEKQTETPAQYVGLKFFNVYGPNEYFKGAMASMVFHGFRQMKESGEIRLFKSENPNYADGGQLRDFVYVKDVCNVVRFFMEHGTKIGLYNVGTGHAQSFSELVSGVFTSLGKEPIIKYIDMPEHLKEKYQYYTQAELSKLRAAGYSAPFMDVKAGVTDYVVNFLNRNYEVY